MNAEKFIEMDGIGPVRFVRNRKARNISIRISREGNVRVTVPGNIPFTMAKSFVEKKRYWIMTARERVQHKISAKRKLEAGTTINIKEYRIIILNTGSRSKTFKVKREENTFSLFLPADFIPDDALHQERVEKEVWKIITAIGKEVLPDRVGILAARYGFIYSGVKIRKMKSRWGSCSSSDMINLSSSLMLLPDHLADYVILHELVHTKRKDHSSRFWKILDEIAGDSSSLRKELRKFVPEL